MILTIEQAKTKWCPFARSWHSTEDTPIASAINRGSSLIVDEVTCIADKCMCWEWKTETEGYCGLSRQR